MFNTQPGSLNITAELLGLSDIKVVEVHADLSNRTIIIAVKSTQESVPCRVCGHSTKGHGSGRKLRLRHLPMFGRETLIEIEPKRGRCEHCDGNPTTTETLDWYDIKSNWVQLL